ncbi:MFS transporter [Saccharopolyspora erythraea]|uniref:MFS transporter n=1 Tax=Saccharopolyspora erythraea TaxID=1836 RepID=UPI001BAC24F4|nr:MFS transporter [Saccharopolyspora erythraea]QUH04295.1 MFS transporter [Saccharopolyspora erythraea]
MVAAADGPEDGRPSRRHWRWAALAAMASYIDAGSIVAAAAGLPLWESYLGLGSTTVGLLTAFSSNAISAAVGALVGGRLGDLFGRKRIYAWDLLVFAFGIAWIVFAVNLPMLFIGYVIVGLAVGADLPTSLALVAEFSPARSRGRLLGLSQIAWCVGPLVTLLLAFALAPLGLLGVRIVFAHLFVVAIVTWLLRRSIVESARWQRASGPNPMAASRLRDLGTPVNRRALLFTGSVYLLWNIAAGTNGAFLPYILQRQGGADQATSVAVQSLSFVLTTFAVLLLFMPLSDSRYRRPVFAVGAVMQVAALAAFVVLPVGIGAALVNVVLFGIGAACAGESFYKLWSQEMFPTVLRGTAQGITFAVSRVVLGVWSFLVPVMLSSAFGLRGMSAIMMGMLVLFGVIGVVFMPDSAGRSLGELDTAHRASASPQRT